MAEFEEREVEIIEGAISYSDRPFYVHVKFSVKKDGTSSCSRNLITKEQFRKLLKEYKWVQFSRTVLGCEWPYMIRQCDDQHSLTYASKR